MTRRFIGPGDVNAQLASMTPFMVSVLEKIHTDGVTYGRAIAKGLEVPYPQAYYTLGVLSARGFLRAEWDDDIPTRKMYRLTPVGVELLERARETDLTHRTRRAPSVNPDSYDRRLRTASLVSWLIRHELVASREDLEHIMNCRDCDTILWDAGDWDFTHELRCDAHPRHAGDTREDRT